MVVVKILYGLMLRVACFVFEVKGAFGSVRIYEFV